MGLVNIDFRTVLALGGVGLLVYYVVTRDAAKAAGAAGDAVVGAANAVNPVNKNNVFAASINSVGKAVGSNTWEQKNWTAGGALFDWIHGTDTTAGDFSTANPYTKK